MFNKLLIIGCGLIGSSILRASIKKKIAKEYFVYEKSIKNNLTIKKINSKVILLKKLDHNISDIDFIILSTPMSSYSRIITSLNKFLTNKAVITDVGSTKKNVLKLKINKLDKSLNWILSHPIAGSEVSGPEYGKANLFNNRWCIITKQKTDKKVEKVERFWKKIGCKVIFMNPEEHDKIFAITSHLPHLIAYNLIKTAQDFQHKERKNLIKFSAGGLRDFSRTAASNEIMWRDIFFNNKKNMLLAINMFVKNLNSFKRNIEKLEDTKLRKKLLNSKKIRKEIIKLKQDVSEPDFGRK